MNTCSWKILRALDTKESNELVKHQEENQGFSEHTPVTEDIISADTISYGYD